MTTAGHNSELTPDQARALKFHHFHHINAQKEKVDAERTEYKRLRGLAKSDQIKLADIDFMMRCATIEDPSIIPEDLKNQMEIASWFNLPLLYQPDLFTDRQPAEERIKESGRAAAFANKDRESGFAGGSDENQLWLEGYDEGKAQFNKDLEEALAKKTAPPAEDEGDTEPEAVEGDPFAEAAE